MIKSVKVSIRTMAAERAGIRHRTMAEAALDELRESIVLGELVPGTPLRLEDLAASLGMSISPIREAVRQLEALGLAEHVPHHGAKVVALDVEELRDLFQVRLALETMAVRRGAERFTEEDRERAADALYRHLELFGDFYSRELGGRGIFQD